MSKPLDIATKEVPWPDESPDVAYAKLRSHTPGRTSFLFDSRDDAEGAGRFSVVGYRVRSGAAMPPTAHTTVVQGARGEEPQPASFPQAMALASVGFISAGLANMRHRVPPFEDEGLGGLFGEGATVLVYDHHERKAHLAGPAEDRLVDRLEHELAHGPEVRPPPSGDPELPRVHPVVDEEVLVARARRTKRFLDDDELPAVVLAQTFVVALGDADPLAAYRALWAAGEAPHGFYVEFAGNPMSPPSSVFGTTHHMLHVSRRDAPVGLAEGLDGALPHPTTQPGGADGLRVIRRVEQDSRQVWGGAVGYQCPGGEGAFALADELVHVVDKTAIITVGLRLEEDTDVTAFPALARELARPRLLAIARASSEA